MKNQVFDDRFDSLMAEIETHNTGVEPCEGMCNFDAAENDVVGVQESSNSHEGAQVCTLCT